MKKLPVVLIFAVLLTAYVSGQDLDGIDPRGLSVVTDHLGQQGTVGKQYALFIAIDSYRSWPALKKPVTDAQEIRDILRKNYYIDEVIELYNQNATKQNIIKTFSDLLGKLGVHDSLFIYYAGHGHLDTDSNTGFWIPVDGGIDLYSQENWLPNTQIRGYISRLKSIHVFMVSDSCFSGDILNTLRALPPNIDNAFYRRAYALSSRQVLTSGSSETVPDQSEFSEALKLCLRKNTEPLIDPHRIYADVRLSVRSTTPLYGTLNTANHQEGATFLFFRRDGLVPPPPVPQPSPSPLPPPSPTAQSYLERGRVFFDRKDYETAIQVFTEAIKLDAAFAEAYAWRGRSYDGDGDTDKAFADAEKAIQLNPQLALPYNTRGNVYRDKKEYDKAIAEYTKAIQFDPNFTIAYRNRGVTYYAKKEYDKAIAEYTRALQIDPNDKWAYYYRGLAYKARADADSTKNR